MSLVTDSILLSTKKLNNQAADYTAFDDDMIIQINSALSDLHQVGIGPSAGFLVEDEDNTWDEFVEDPRLSSVKTYVGLKTKLYFDPPNNSFGISMMEKQLDELLWRLKAAQEDIDAEDGEEEVPVDDEDLILDGGEA